MLLELVGLDVVDEDAYGRAYDVDGDADMWDYYEWYAGPFRDILATDSFSRWLPSRFHPTSEYGVTSFEMGVNLWKDSEPIAVRVVADLTDVPDVPTTFQYHHDKRTVVVECWVSDHPDTLCELATIIEKYEDEIMAEYRKHVTNS